MGDDPSPGQVEEVEVEVDLDAGEQGFAEALRDPAEEAYPVDVLDLTPLIGRRRKSQRTRKSWPWGIGSPAPAANARVLRPSANV